jgi:NAD(P)-dependent dehydrogenase (short-subunit alcohol dehydrogenase family)
MALFTNRVILLTGAASGIGLATAHLLASRGAKLSLADANAEGLYRAVKEIRERWPDVDMRTLVVDVRNEEQVKGWVKETVAVWGRVDGAANVAGVIGMLCFFPPPGVFLHVQDRSVPWERRS